MEVSAKLVIARGDAGPVLEAAPLGHNVAAGAVGIAVASDPCAAREVVEGITGQTAGPEVRRHTENADEVRRPHRASGRFEETDKNPKSANRLQDAGESEEKPHALRQT